MNDIEFSEQSKKQSVSTLIFDFLIQILKSETIETLLEILSKFPLNQDCEVISIRRCIINEQNVPKLEPEAFWVKSSSQVEPWTKTIHIDDETLAQLWIMSGGPPMFIENIADFALFTDDSREFHQKQGLVSLYHILLMRHNRPIGVLSVMWCEPQVFTPEYKAVIELMGWVLAPALENTYLKKENRLLSLSIKELELRLHKADIALHSMAHDLKQPISVIISTTSLLDSYLDRLSKEQIIQKIDRITSASLGMNDWISSILLLAQVRGTEIPELEAFDAKSALDATIDSMQPFIEHYSASIQYDDSLHVLPLVIGREVWVRHIWANLISNACKYGGSPPEIMLGAVISGEVVSFTIRDNGSGIPDDKLKLIFEPFARLSQAEKSAGTGIGLTTVKLLVQKLEGEVGVSSGSDGSTFWFTLKKSGKTDE